MKLKFNLLAALGIVCVAPVYAGISEFESPGVVGGFDSEGGDPSLNFDGPSLFGAASLISSTAVVKEVSNRLLDLRNGVGAQESIGVALESSKGGLSYGEAPFYESKSHSSSFRPGQLSLWGGVYYQDTELEAQNGFQPEIEVGVFGGDVGIDLQFTPELLLGFAFGFARTDVDSDGNAAVVAPFFLSDFDYEIDTFKLNPYFLYTREIGPGKLFLDGQYAYGFSDYAFTGGEFEGDFNQIESSAGYLFQSQFVNHGPVVSARYLNGEVEGVGQLGGALDDFEYESFSFQLGYTVSAHIPMGAGVLVPNVTTSWERQTDDTQSSFGGVPLGIVDENLFIVNAGASYYINGFNIGANYEGRVADIETSSFVGLRAGLSF